MPVLIYPNPDFFIWIVYFFLVLMLGTDVKLVVFVPRSSRRCDPLLVHWFVFLRFPAHFFYASLFRQFLAAIAVSSSPVLGDSGLGAGSSTSPFGSFSSNSGLIVSLTVTANTKCSRDWICRSLKYWFSHICLIILGKKSCSLHHVILFGTLSSV